MTFIIKAAYERYNPHLLMIITHILYTFQYFISKASFNQGLNPLVYVTYRCTLGGLLMFPFAYFLERGIRPKLTFVLFLEIVLLSFMGVGLTTNMYFASLKYSSPTFVTSMLNTIASLTFVIAVILRMEVVDARNSRGIAKILGTLLCLGRVTILTLYKGPTMRSMKHALVNTSRGSFMRIGLKGLFLQLLLAFHGLYFTLYRLLL
ncbi:hypothetical protein SLE2022_208350 [Rubroshorea leprosula]